MRRLLYILGATALLLIAAVVAGFVALQTQSGQAWLAATLSRVLSSGGNRIEISGLSGTVPTAMHASRIMLADTGGVWLEVEDATLKLRLRDLLHRQLTVRRLGAHSIEVRRAPGDGPSGKPSQSFLLPRLPVDIVIKSLAVERLHLAEPLLGEAVALRIDGEGGLAGDGAAARLAVDRTDKPGNLHLGFRLGRDDVLAMHLDAAEPSGALLQHGLDASEPMPATIAVHGEGPLDAWRGTIDASAGTQDKLHATVKLERQETLRLTADGSLFLSQLLPSKIRAASTKPIGFTAQARLDDARIVVERLTIDSGLATIAGQGALDRKDGRFTGAADVNAPDLRAIGAMLDTPLGGVAGAHIRAEGTLAAPHVDVALVATSLNAAVRAERVSLNLQGTKRGETWALTGSGDAAGLIWPDDRAGGLPDRITLALDALLDSSAARLTLDSVSLRGADIQIAASGTVDGLDAAPRGRGKITLSADDLSRWRDFAGLALGGHLTVDTDLALDAGAVNATITAKSADLATGERHLDALLGGQIDLHAKAARDASGGLTVDAVTLSGKDIAITGNARSNAAFSSLDARLAADLPRLAVLADALGAPTQGDAKMQMRLTGAPAAPRAQIDAQASDLRFGAQRLDRLTATATLSDALAPSGTLAATLKAGTLDATADAAFARTDADTIEISHLTLRAAGSEANGSAKINTARLGATGSLSARVADLSPWSPLAGTTLAGSLDARVNLAEKDGQRADIDASVNELRLADANIAAERIKLDARLSDLLGKPAGRATIDAAAVALPGLRLDSVRASAQSTRPEQFTISLDAQGVLRPAADAQRLRLATAGEVAMGRGEQRIRVTRLTARVGDYAVLSRTPLTVAIGANRFNVEGLDLGVGDGRVTGSMQREPARLAAQLQARNLPLALIELARPGQKIAGTADAVIRMSGTAARPDGQMELNLRDVRIAAAGDLPPVSATALGTWKGEALDLVGQIAAPDGTKLDLRGSAPLRLDAATMMPILIQDGALRATLKGDGRLERWAALLPLGEDRVGGRYAIDLSVAGTPARPEPHGRLAVRDGRYVNFAAGTEISDVVAEISGDGTHFVLSRLIGRDGAKGTLEGHGALDLLPAGHAFDLTARFANFGFMRREDVTASGGGELRLAGTAAAAKLSGHVRIERAEIRIPERLPASIPNLPVIVVDGSSGMVLSKPEERAGGSTIALAVDVDIPARAFVRGRGLDSEWRGALEVGGTTATPRLTGKLETVRGDFSLLGKRFTLTDSTIAFVGGAKIDPELGVTAQYQTAAILAQVLVNGPLSNPSIKLTSQPEMPQDEVLARVLFGRSVTEMTPAQGLELAQAAATLASGGGPGILDRVRSATGLDRLDVSSKETTTNGGPSGTTATAGKYLSDRVFVGVEQGLKADSTRPKVEVEITPNVTVESSVGASSAGVGVNWKWDY